MKVDGQSRRLPSEHGPAAYAIDAAAADLVAARASAGPDCP